MKNKLVIEREERREREKAQECRKQRVPFVLIDNGDKITMRARAHTALELFASCDSMCMCIAICAIQQKFEIQNNPVKGMPSRIE